MYDVVKLNKDLMDFIYQSPCSFNAACNISKMLLSNNFIKLNEDEDWNLEKGKKYFITKNNSSVAAFAIGKNNISENGFKIIGSHSDSPGFRVKENPEIIGPGGYLQLNTEVYGGPILSTWFDRPLCIAGKCALKSSNPMRPIIKNINLNTPILIIPNIAIHQNREANKGFEINPQKHTLPIMGLTEEANKDKFFINLIANELNVSIDDILSFELSFYEYAKGEFVGLNNEFISIGRQDNLSMAYLSTLSLIDTQPNDGINLAIIFDNEEIGSRTKQGAGSPFLKTLIDRIILSLSKEEENYYKIMNNSFFISSDMAHSIHPNWIEKSDPVNKPVINKGVAIKIASNGSYTSDSESIAIFKMLCGNYPYQVLVNRSDTPGGSTIGPISSTQLPIRSVDIGNPLLSMHSCRELGGTLDNVSLINIFNKFYSL